MIERLLIKNYQKHKKLDIQFDPGVTTFIGRTEAGKSAVIRALAWLCFNRPAGIGFMRHGATRTVAQLKVDGITIKKTATKSKRLYRVGDQELKAFGASVPEPVENVLQVGPENFQRQMDPPFWFSETPGAVSRHLNQIINLEEIDAALSRASKIVRETRNTEENALSRLKTHQNRLESLGWVKGYISRLENLEAATGRLERLRGGISNLEILIERAGNLKKRVAVETPSLAELEEPRARLKAIQEQREDLQEAVENYSRYQKKVRTCEKELREARKLRDELQPEICPKCGQVLKGS